MYLENIALRWEKIKSKKNSIIYTLIIAIMVLSLIFVLIVNFERVREDADGPEAELIAEEPEPIPVDPITEDRPYWYLLIADKD